ncbi:cytochrome c3 family protein [Anaeromyxobacter oryzae]|uniref:Cytochrome c domain-containing protein n=1 Tax=Anaeromyxobacter oryzae TaxID=2918170 RepID=A0ABM7X0C8_9BACT|nr:cytochrome c3 family protein [Anaeromyxobacter oryzae]BDG05239.1 hypothetical protein AMOR_42350 [Anaeromyxobacter oryzae]
MRRISLALALTGAVTAACSGGAKSSDGSGKGVPGGSFTVVVQNGQAINGAPANPGLAIQGGYVTSTPAGIDCGIAGHALCSATFPADTAVSLTATPVGTDPANSQAYLFLGWAGDCQGEGACSLTGASDKYIVVMFAGQRTGHGNFTDPAAHGPAYLNYSLGVAGALDCTSCHGANLQGQGIAISCATCHSWPLGGHFVLGGAFGSHNSGDCARCHNGSAFRDFTGADGTASQVLSATMPKPTLDNTTFPTTDPGVTMLCSSCHNPVTEPIAGAGTWTKQHVFTSFPVNNTLTLDASTALCAQCHDGARPGYEVAKLNAQLTGVTDLDASLGTAGAGNNKLVRAHYLPAASTLYGEEAGSYFEYSIACSVAGKYTQADCTAAAGTWKGAQMSDTAAERNNYTGRNEHGGLNSCVSCHNPHTGELPKDSEILARCGGCHNDELTGLPVRTFAELEESRQFGFEGDIDGDGVPGSVKVEINGLRAKLLATITSYAKNVTGTQVCFDGENRFYADDGANGGIAGDGICATASCSLGDGYHDSATCTAAGGTWYAGETNSPNFTARLLRASYNFLIATNDEGAWAHNPRYAIEVMYDAIADLNAGLVAKGFTASPNGNRAFNGHFGAAEDASKYAAIIYHGASNATTLESLPPMGFTSGACYQCHGGKGGFQAYISTMPAALTSAVITDANKIAAFQCSVCHTYNGTDMKGIRTDVAKVYFPPQKNGAGGEVSFDAANLPKSFAVCGTCHSARENKASVDAKGLVSGTFSATLVNPHYLGAAATVMGTRAKSWYEYDGKSYTAFPAFWKSGTNGNAPGPHGSPHGAECTGCHQPKATKHEFGVDFTYCAGCHAGNYALAPKEEEYASMKAELLAALDAYAQANLTAFQAANGADATGICYDGSVYGYVLVKKATGCSATGAKLDLNAMKAGYNLHWMNKDPGGWAHNEYYVMQLVYDSIKDLGGTPSFTVTASSTDATLNRP